MGTFRVPVLTLVGVVLMLAGGLHAQAINEALTGTGLNSGGGSGVWGPANLNNNDTIGTFNDCWTTGGGWVEIQWASPVTVSSLKIWYTRYRNLSAQYCFHKGNIQWWDGTTYQLDQHYDDNNYGVNVDADITLTQTRTTTRIRIADLNTGMPGMLNVMIQELQIFSPAGPTLTVNATPGTVQQVYSTAEGPGGIGVHAGTFEISSNSEPGCVLSQIEIEASGTGDDSVAYLEVAIYQDSNDNSIYEATDTFAVTASNVFAANDGSIVFDMITSQQDFPINTSRRFFVVVKLAGTASPGDTFKFSVLDITMFGTNVYKSGVPSAVMEGLEVEAGEFTFADVSSATPTTVFLGTSGNVCQSFTIDYPGGAPDKPASITVTGLGTADEVADLTGVELWYDSDNSGSFDAQLDTLVDSTVYTLDNGTVTFDMASHPNFQPADLRQFFVVYNLNTNAGDQETFRCYVSAAAVGAMGGASLGLPIPSANGSPGLEVSANVLIATMNGPIAALTVNSNTTGPHGDGALLCDVTLEAAPGGSWTVDTLTFTGSGTGLHDLAYDELGLYEDDGNGTWDGATTDSLAAPVVNGFSASSATFTLTLNAFPAGTSRRFFLAAKMSGTATTGQTFNARLQQVTGTPPPAGTITGVPTADSTALIIDTAALTVGNGPSQPSAITHRAGTPGSYTIAQFQLTALNDAVTVNGVTLTTGGSGNWTTDVDSTAGVSVYLDDGNNAFDPANDILLAQEAGGAVVTAGFGTPVNLPVTGTANIWVRVGLTAAAGQGAIATADTFTLSIANGTDVNATSMVLLGTPAPNSITLRAIEFDVTSFSPTDDLPQGGKAITIQGTGFVTPVVVKIGGVICPGTAAISGGTQITGLFVPAGTGSKLPIEVTSGTLPPQVLTQTFTYRNVSTTGSGTGGGGCSSGNQGAWALLLLAPLAAMATRRRKA